MSLEELERDLERLTGNIKQVKERAEFLDDCVKLEPYIKSVPAKYHQFDYDIRKFKREFPKEYNRIMKELGVKRW